MSRRKANPDWQDAVIHLLSALVGALAAKFLRKKKTPRKRPIPKKRAARKKVPK